ncbi:hypothetical protein BS50DRAFT_681043 [Corynespora cassiicola Philippines]|uniref:Histidine-specific methyltransferase SAM-dependent domain-containing protein n=1 Tax=Corynespora cassiicola Philippines TaxID=1448308 RepID=A0A2T2N755_CORCC|nr:hypothetical protein BS50DRAFT_681043 [Corynespora cassiicola Philippines]
MFSVDILSEEQFQEQQLRSAIFAGLNSVPKTLPSILLWDDAGHDLFKQITKSPSYCGPQADHDIMKDKIDKICQFLGNDGVLIELGAGSIPHTSIILDELCQRRVKTQYLAHDVVQSKLYAGLCRLAGEFHGRDLGNFLKLRGVVGTYEQFFRWLSKTSELRGRRIVVLWLGNCLSHYSDAEFPTMVDALMQSLSVSQVASSTLLLAVNGCQEADVMRQAYDSPDGTSLAFVTNALRHANRILGAEAFHYNHWTPIFSINSAGTSIQWSFRSKQQDQLVIGKRTIACEAGEDIELITIHKRDGADVAKLLVHSRSELVDAWSHQAFAWSWYVITNTLDVKERTGNVGNRVLRSSEIKLCNWEEFDKIPVVQKLGSPVTVSHVELF